MCYVWHLDLLQCDEVYDGRRPNSPIATCPLFRLESRGYVHLHWTDLSTATNPACIYAARSCVIIVQDYGFHYFVGKCKSATTLGCLYLEVILPLWPCNLYCPCGLRGELCGRDPEERNRFKMILPTSGTPMLGPYAQGTSQLFSSEHSRWIAACHLKIKGMRTFE